MAEEEGEAEGGEEIISLELAEVSQCVLPGNNRNEIEIQFHESDTVEQGTDQLVQIRFYVPPDPEADPTDKDSQTAAELMQHAIVTKASIRSSAAGNVIAKFDETQGTFLTPRGRYTIELFYKHLRLRGNKYDYKIKYDDISKLFLLPKPDDYHMAFIIALEKPIRQGQQRYQYLIMQTNKNQSELEILLDEGTLQNEYGGELQPLMQGSLSNLIAKTFKVVTKKKVFVPGKFLTKDKHACVKCALRANEGHLYPLEKQFIFIHKPAVLIRFEEIESVEFQRFTGEKGNTRNFDLCVSLISAGTGELGATKEYVFSGIDRADYDPLYTFLAGKSIRIKNLQSSNSMADAKVTSQPRYDERERSAAAAADEDEDESSEDADYKASSGSEDDDSNDSEDISDDADEDSADDGGDDSDLEEYRKEAKKAISKEVPTLDKKRKAPEPTTKAKSTNKTKEKKVVAEKKQKKKRAKKDPNAPKRPTTAYFYFMNENRARLKKENPSLTFGELGKLLGEQYKKLSGTEKKKYEDLAAEDKKRYKKEMESFESKSKDNSKVPQTVKKESDDDEDSSSEDSY